jgi:hypothetical protein
MFICPAKAHQNITILGLGNRRPGTVFMPVSVDIDMLHLSGVFRGVTHSHFENFQSIKASVTKAVKLHHPFPQKTLFIAAPSPLSLRHRFEIPFAQIKQPKTNPVDFVNHFPDNVGGCLKNSKLPLKKSVQICAICGSKKPYR